MKEREIAHIKVDRMLTPRQLQMRPYLFEIGAITYRFTAFVPDIFKCDAVKNERRSRTLQGAAGMQLQKNRCF